MSKKEKNVIIEETKLKEAQTEIQMTMSRMLGHSPDNVVVIGVNTNGQINLETSFRNYPSIHDAINRAGFEILMSQTQMVRDSLKSEQEVVSE